MTDLDQAILDAKARLDDNATHLTTLAGQRATALDALGAARAANGNVDDARSRLANLDREMQERAAAAPHLERAHASAIAARDLATREGQRAKLRALGEERLRLAAVIDEHVTGLATSLRAANRAAEEMLTLHRQLGTPDSASYVPRRNEGMRHVLAHALKQLVGNPPQNIPPGYQISVVDLEQELLAQES